MNQPASTSAARPGRWIALDVGSKTIGVALSDEARDRARPLLTIKRAASIRADMSAVRAIIAEHSVTAVVVGYPLQMDGLPGTQAALVDAFIERLRGSVRIPIIREDERLTTWEANEALILAGVKAADRKNAIDAAAAAVILQAALDRVRRADGAA